MGGDLSIKVCSINDIRNCPVIAPTAPLEGGLRLTRACDRVNALVVVAERSSKGWYSQGDNATNEF